jgi:multiple sugar transport system permease protein
MRAQTRRFRAGARHLGPWVYLSPFVIGVTVFTLVPVLASLGLSFTKYNVFSPPTYIGLQNFAEMLGSSQFWASWRLTIVYALTTVGFTLTLGLTLALTLHRARRASGFWKVLYYLPSVLGGAGEALMLLLVWDKNGLVNSILSAVGVSGPAYLQSADWALAALVLSRYWTIGNIVLLFLAARASVPRDLYEVAEMDGAGSWATFRAITFPLMTPIILFNLVLGIITSLQVFTQIFIMTQGGPVGATRLIGIHIYDLAFQNQRFGYASAVSWSLFGVAVLVSLLLIKSSGRWVHYQFDAAGTGRW